jgi:hypothetical protein
MRELFMMRRIIISCLLCLWGGVWTGCTTWETTTTARTAVEQLLLSTAADRCLNQSRLVAGNRKVFLDTQYLDAYDKLYVISMVRERLGSRGLLVDKADGADIVVEIRSGGLAIDKSDFLFGVPSLPLPITLANGAPIIKTPELPLFKMISRRSRAKIAMFATDVKTRKQLGSTGTLYGEAHYTDWILLFIPFTQSDIWTDAESEAAENLLTVAPAAVTPSPNYDYYLVP